MNRYKSMLTLVAILMISGLQTAVARIVYYHNDGLGSPVAATDEAGEVLWRAGYRPYGDRDQRLDDHAVSLQNSRWYTGHQHDDVTGLTYMQARYYDPVIGRFTGVDPLAFRVQDPQSFNQYSYARNNPYKYVDPDGLDAAVISWKGTAAAGGGAGLGGGVYFTFPGEDPAPFDVGVVASASLILGADVAFTVNFSGLRGGRENIEGTSLETGVTIPLTGLAGPSGDYASIVNVDEGKWAGHSVGFGLALFPAASASITESVILFSTRDWLQGGTDVSGSDSGQAGVAEYSNEELSTWFDFIAN
jgi:RHS repeat-associated protein